MELQQYLIEGRHQILKTIWQVLYRGGFYRGGPILMSALSGIDQALWDIKGKFLGFRLRFIGGAVRHKMKMLLLDRRRSSRSAIGTSP